MGLLTPEDAEAIANIEKLTGMAIPTLETTSAPEAAKPAKKAEAPKPEKKAEKPRKEEAPRRAEKREKREPEKRREPRKPEATEEADDGWNGPVPSFLSFSAD